MSHNGHHESAVRLGGDTDMGGGIAMENILAVIKTGTENRMILQGNDHGTQNQRQQRQMRFFLSGFGIEVLAQGFQLGDIDFLDIGYMRDVAF